MYRCAVLLFAGLVYLLNGNLFAQSNTLSYLDEVSEAYYPDGQFPKLTTPQWVGEEGVDVVVTLAIDDMRDPAKYEAYLRPILQRLKQIDGRAPVSIMTCDVDPTHPQLQTWIGEGLSIEVHTVDHPCPCLQGGNFQQAKSTYDRCVDMMAAIPGNHPVAFRTPCCDSQNTPSPRLWQEIFNRRTANGSFLQADSSVFNVFTSADSELPEELLVEPDGSPRFEKYIPFPSFVNKIENYPYPYVIGKLCWQFPCMVPSDWEAQNLHRPNNPKTVADMQAALDATVIKQGMFNLVFHPHGWMRNDQVVELIDYAQQKYGKRVKFLTFKECVDRIQTNLLIGQPLRDPLEGGDNGVRIVDLNKDGYLDVMIGNETRQQARIWQPQTGRWQEVEHDLQFTAAGPQGRVDRGVQWGRLSTEASVSLLVNNEHQQTILERVGDNWKARPLPEELKELRTSLAGVDQGVRLRDLDGDGISEIIVANPQVQRTLKRDEQGRWQEAAGPLPLAIVDSEGRDNGLRFVDLDQDGHDDVIVSNPQQRAIRLYDVDTGGFTRVVQDVTDVPLIVRDGTNNGAWFAAGHMWIQNEDTHRLPDGVDRRSFEQLLGRTEPGPRSPDVSLRSLQTRPGFQVELVAAEPLVMDPIAIDWGADGKLWVVEMADYPLGLDDQGQPGGRVRYLEDTDGDGKYDKSTLFLDKIPFPTGVIAWQDGVLVSAAPTVFFAADRDGDGKAEVREELYRGFGEGNQQHRFNGFERGLDNWLYLANGDSGGTVESLKTGEKLEIRGQDVRIRPADGALDAQAGQTQFGRHRDDHGNWFGCSNPLPVRHYVLADHYLRRNPFVTPPPAHRDIARADNTQLFPISRVLSHWSGYQPPAPGTPHRFTSACSTMVYRDSLLGDAFQHSTFTCEPVHNLVHHRRLVPSGVSFESVRPEDESDTEFLASTDSWFRPTTVTTGPDGALWITDMYRLVIEHPEWIDDEREKTLFLRAGHDRGRIYRVYPSGKTPRPMLKLSDMQGPQLVEQLASPNGRVRDLAQHLLIERGEASERVHASERGLLEALLRSSPHPLARLHALCTLDGLQIDAATLQVALRDPHPSVQRHAIRIAEPFLNHDDETSDDWIALLDQCEQADPHVRLQLAYSLGACSSDRAAKLLATIAAAGKDDEYLRAAVLSSLNEGNVRAFREAIQGAPAAAVYQAPLLEMAVRRQDRVLLADLISGVIDRCRHMPSVENIGALAAALAPARRRGVALNTAQQASLAELGTQLKTIVTDSAAALPLRQAAVALLALVHQDFRADVLSLVTASEPVELQVAAIRALSGQDMEVLLERLPGLSPTVRSAILDDAFAREATAVLLVDALRSESIAIDAIGAEHRQKMKTHASEKVRSAAAELFDAPLPSSDKRALLERYSRADPHHGDAKRGQAVFTKHCAACHQVQGIGHRVGPDLAALQNRSPEALITAILDPNAAVEDKYRSYSILTLDGIAQTGIISSESTVAVELTTQSGKTLTILRDDIEHLQSTGKSLMPEQMEDVMAVSDISDLLAFLNQLGPAAKVFAGNQPTTIQAMADGTLELSATAARIFGEQIRFESTYQNIGFWGNAHDRVEWTVAVEHPGAYDVWLDYACPPQTAGNPFVFRCGQQTLLGNVQSSGSWDTYHQVQIGSITLPQGTVVAGLQAGGELNQWLLDLRGIRLVPAKTEP